MTVCSQSSLQKLEQLFSSFAPRSPVSTSAASSPQRLRHVNEVAGDFQRDFWRHRSRSRFLVAKMFVHWHEVAARADRAQVRYRTTSLGKLFFRERHEPPAEAEPLQLRAQRKQPDVAAFAPHFRV